MDNQEVLQAQTKSIFVAIVGRPNVGKSSLLNRLVGEKVAIVTAKPQTTRTKITGILTQEAVQYVFLDTPGIHNPRTKLGERMAKTAVDSVAEVDAVLMLFEPYGELSEAELQLIRDIRVKKASAIAVINKTDTLKKASDLVERIAFLTEQNAFCSVRAISVQSDEGCAELLEQLTPYAVESPHYFPDDAYTDMPEKALVAEILREKMLLFLRDEIPHGTAVTVESFKERERLRYAPAKPDANTDTPEQNEAAPETQTAAQDTIATTVVQTIVDIDVNIYCEKKSHKGMIIGKGGQMLKTIATAAREDCEAFLDAKVNLQCWVKIKDDWRDNDFLLNNFGFKK